MKPQLVGLPSGWPLIHDQAAHVAVPHVSMLPLGLIDTYGGEWAAFNGRIQLILQSGTPIQQSGEAIVIAGSYSACVTEPRRFSCAIALPRSNLMLEARSWKLEAGSWKLEASMTLDRSLTTA